VIGGHGQIEARVAQLQLDSLHQVVALDLGQIDSVDVFGILGGIDEELAMRATEGAVAWRF